MILKLKDYKFLKEFHEKKITELEKRLMVHRELLKDAEKNIEELTVKGEITETEIDEMGEHYESN